MRTISEMLNCWYVVSTALNVIFHTGVENFRMNFSKEAPIAILWRTIFASILAWLETHKAVPVFFLEARTTIHTPLCSVIFWSESSSNHNQLWIIVSTIAVVCEVFLYFVSSRTHASDSKLNLLWSIIPSLRLSCKALSLLHSPSDFFFL